MRFTVDAAKNIYECYKVIESFQEAERLRFYELFSLQLTNMIRVVTGDSMIEDREKIKRVELINEILHRSTAKIPAMRLKTHEWTEKSFWGMVAGYVNLNHAVGPLIEGAAKEALKVVSASPPNS
jgi:hypothetical protein